MADDTEPKLSPDIPPVLQAELRQIYERMQTPESHAATDALFNATPAELGEAAVKEARRIAALAVSSQQSDAATIALGKVSPEERGDEP